MAQIEAIEFPFVNGLPKREKSRFMTFWDRYCQFVKLSEDKGRLVPAGIAGKILGVSKQRVYDLIKNGSVEAVQFEGHHYLTENSLIAYAKTERKAGRPVKLADDAEREGDLKASWRLARSFATGK